MNRRTMLVGLMCLIAASCGPSDGAKETEKTSSGTTTADSKATPASQSDAGTPPATTSAPMGQDRTLLTNSLKQIGLAFHNYYDTRMHFPNDITAADRTPLLSWRVAILPFITEKELYEQFKLDEPWDSPANKPLIAKMPKIYAFGNEVGKSKTVLRGFSASGQALESGKNIDLFDFKDGTSNTILIAETESPVEWTKPDSLESAARLPNRLAVLFADGSVKLVHLGSEFRKALTIAGGEIINYADLLGETSDAIKVPATKMQPVAPLPNTSPILPPSKLGPPSTALTPPIPGPKPPTTLRLPGPPTTNTK
ncbi:MAG: DUF1559 domain-containing protein [Bacteroidales bacterium]|nr:DUF1559 domain-containing protein [Bacteroidales bacterium]